MKSLGLEENLVNHVFNKDLRTRMHEEFLKLNDKKTTQFFKMRKYVNKHIIQMANKHAEI